VALGRSGTLVVGPGNVDELLFFANDVSFAYCNNSGHVIVKILRQA
jgi:hypothetical protein